MVYWLKYTAVIALMIFVLQSCVWSQIPPGDACAQRAECKRNLSCSRDLSCGLYPGEPTDCSCYTQIIQCEDADCTCPLGKYRQGCQDILSDPCEAVGCLDRGECKRGICECTCGHSEPDCVVDLCDPNPCINAEETCFTVVDGIECRCIHIQDDYILTSPNYPNNYPGRFSKCYIIIGRPGQNITLHLHAEFDIEANDDCLFDYLKIQEEKYCGTVPPDTIIRPPGDNTTVRFYTDSSLSRMGFNLTISYTDGLKKYLQ